MSDQVRGRRAGWLRRAFLEVPIIVGSILLAFSIDAYWDRWKERSEVREILEGLQSEYLEHQERSVALFDKLLGDVLPAQRKTFEGFLDYAIRHRDIIVRFGRFPHRNTLLGRSSTPEEEVFLTQPGSSF